VSNEILKTIYSRSRKAPYSGSHFTKYVAVLRILSLPHLAANLQRTDLPDLDLPDATGGGWPATNEPRTGDVEAACSGQIGMAETRDNGYINDKLLKRDRDSCPRWPDRA